MMKLVYQKDLSPVLCVLILYEAFCVCEMESLFCQGILILYKQNQYIENIVLYSL